MHVPRPERLIVLLLLAAAVAPASAPPATVQDAGRIVAIADIHGEFDSLLAMLEATGIADRNGRWTGGRATLIQTGDFTDRGPDVRKVMDLLMSLEQQAAAAGGRVVVLLGNHEMLAIVGEPTDVAPAEYASFADSDSERRRREALGTYIAHVRRRTRVLGQPVPDETTVMEERWLRAHPPGYIERARAMSPEGRYGRWLRRLPVTARARNTVFMHAGIDPDLSSMSLEEIEQRIRGEIAAFDRYRQHMLDRDIALPFYTLGELVVAARDELERHRETLGEREARALRAGRRFDPDPDERRHGEMLEGFLSMGRWLSLHPDGVLWFRGFARWTDAEGTPLVQRLLDAYGAERFVVGHSTQESGRVRSRFGGGVILADTGMLESVYGGRAAAVELSDETVRAVYLDREPVELDPGNLP